MKLELRFSPGACSRVSLIALEETGAPFESRVLAFMAGEHRAPDYLRLHPGGKVPLLLVDGQPLIQTVAILTFLAQSFPDVGLLPTPASRLEQARLQAELLAFSADLHPIVTRIAFPQFLLDHAEGADALRAKALHTMTLQLGPFESRLSAQPWLAGDRWSVIDAYLFWVWSRLASAGFDPAPFPAIAAHDRQNRARPAVIRALAREEEGVRILEARGLMPRPRS